MCKKKIKIDKFRKELLIIKLTIYLLFPSDLISADTQNSQNLHTFNGHTYEKVELPMSWTEASKFAGEKSGTLVKIESFQENTFLKSFMSQTQTSASDGGESEYFWLGGSDVDIEGDWRWSDRTKIDASQITAYDLWGKGPGFNTQSGEPDDFMNNQDCLAMGVKYWPKRADATNHIGKPGEWNDISCENKLAFVVEYDTSANFDEGILQVKHLTAGEKNYRATFSITPCKTICLKLISAEEVNIPSTDLSNKFEFDTLKIRKLKYKDKFYEVNLRLTDSENLLFEAINSNLTSSLQTFPSTSWIVVEPEEVGMNSDKLQEAVNYAFDQVTVDGESLSQNTQGLVIIRHGAVVAEKYAAESTKDTIATSWSSAKSFTSALMGVALDKGYISSIDVPAADFIEEWKNNESQNVVIKNLLMMSSGLKEKGGNDGLVMYSGNLKEDGSIDYSKPVNNRIFSIQDREVDPTRAHWRGANYNWNYQNADTQVIGEIIEQTTKMSLYDFANSVLFSKIGMTASWWKDAFDNYMPWCCIDATTRDFARFGLLYAREGKWEQETIISGKWVAESTALTTSITSSLPYGYGYFWWPSVSNEWFMALGSRSNNIYVHPGLDLVAVRNSTLEIVGDTNERKNSYHLTEFPAKWDHIEFFQTVIDSVVH